MKSFHKTTVLFLVFTMVCAGICAGEDKAPAKNVLCTTFPIYQIARNVAQGSDGVNLSLMISANAGCPHDYVLTPQDMKKLADSQVLIINGLGLEEFLGEPVKKANPNIVVIDSSKGIKGLLQYSEEEADDDHDGEAKGKKEKDEDHVAEHRGKDEGTKDHKVVTPEKDGKDEHPETEPKEHDGCKEEHHHEGSNPHLFVSPRMAAKITLNIAEELSKVDPANKALYNKNAKAYAERLNKLADEFVAEGKKLKNNRVVMQHGAFDYLAKETGLEIVAVVAEHAGQEPSASQMLSIIKTIREKKVGAIFTEPQYSAKTVETLAKETGISAAELDPVANGPANAGLDYYEKTMKKNLETLKRVLGSK